MFASMVLSVAATIAQIAPFVASYLLIAELARHVSDLSGVDTGYVWNLAFFSLGAIGVYGVLTYASLMLSHVAAFNILHEIRVAMADKLARLPMGYFTSRSSGAIKKVLAEDVERVELFVAHHIPDLTSAVVFPLLTGAYLLMMDWRLAVAAFVPVPLALALQARMFRSPDAGGTIQDYYTAMERMNGSIVEYVRGMPVVKVFSQTVDEFQRLKDDIYRYRDLAKKVTSHYSVLFPGYQVLISSSLLAILPVSVYLLTRTSSYESFVSVVFLFLILAGGMYFPLFKLMWMGGLVNQISEGVRRIDEILFIPETPEPLKPEVPDDASIEFRKVSFSYGEAPVLSDVSFRAEPGTVTALVGRSGAGKSTIAHLLPRFWDVDEGEILMGGVDIRKMRTEALMDHVSFVFQDGFLFFDTIEENIRMGNGAASMEDVIHAARAAQCHEFIERLSSGYMTLVGEGGTYLSGGERQRVALARAILKDSPVVVLDEATAYADPENEGKMLAAFSELIRSKTVLVIAHRLSTVTDADQILVVDRGAIVERGTHEALLAGGGRYRRMWEAHNRSAEWTLDIGEGVQA